MLKPCLGSAHGNGVYNNTMGQLAKVGTPGTVPLPDDDAQGSYSVSSEQLLLVSAMAHSWTSVIDGGISYAPAELLLSVVSCSVLKGFCCWVRTSGSCSCCTSVAACRCFAADATTDAAGASTSCCPCSRACWVLSWSLLCCSACNTDTTSCSSDTRACCSRNLQET